MKKGLTVLTVLLVWMFCIQPVYASNVNAGGSGTETSVYSVTVAYNGNGGTGAMANQTVSSSGTAVKLSANSFSRKGYTFTGWNTKADGKGTAYADRADVTSLAAADTDGTTITLYAQWSINAPKLKKLTATVPGTLKITYSKVSQAGKYQIQYATTNKFKKATAVEVKKGTSSTVIHDFIPNKTYYVRMRSYDKKAKQYGAWSNVLKKKTKKGATLLNTKASTGIEADVTLSGSGTGYHAKLVLLTPVSAVSYGIQFDSCAVAPYTGKAMAMIENVASNAAGGQQYDRPGNKSLKVGKKYHLMITINSKGNGNVYLDYKKIGSFSNPQMANQAVYPRVEAAVRLNGDSVKATFDNIRLTRGGKVQKGIFADGTVFKSNQGIKTKRTKNQNKVVISGTGAGIDGDWDSDYEHVSGVYQWN